MIAYLSGKIIEKEINYIILNVNDVGYKIYISHQLLQKLSLNTKTSLWIHLVVRENLLDLYGFEIKEEKIFFEKLISISGVGPKSALLIMSISDLNELKQAIVNENIQFLTSVPGIGKKSAERIIIELKDSLEQIKKDNYNSTEYADVVDALISLGYSKQKVLKAISQIKTEDKGIQQQIKEALSILSNK